jgi:uncharacterized Zn-binding protein involved in type VI secretion
MFPAARLADMTVTGDLITGPGVPTVLICNMPASVVGDMVAGSVCTGTIATGGFTVLISGRPVTRVTSSVVGANTMTGIPMSTIIAPPCSMTVIIGG